jgi:pimeloyl-ACP methyl ester carboxylesterase
MPRSLAQLSTLLLCVTLTGIASADEWPMPHSLAEAKQMEKATALPLTPFYRPPSLKGTVAGDLLHKEAFDGYNVPKGTQAVRILYHSLDAHGKDVATSAVVLIPAGTPPARGWPVIAWAHGTTGVARVCAPSLDKNLSYGEEGVFPMVRAGFAVVATDYQGLGTPGPHQYINKIAQSNDVIYSVRAAHQAVKGLDERWVVVGHSQGGYAAWGVDEMEAKRQDPGFLGAVSVAAGADLGQLTHNMAQAGPEAAMYIPYIAFAFRALNPSFDPASMLSGVALKLYPSVTTQGCFDYAYGATLDAHNQAPVVHEKGWQEHAAVKEFIATNTLGKAPLAKPLLLIAGDADRSVPYALVQSAARDACAAKLPITFHTYPGLDHDPTMDQSTPEQLAWIRARYAGEPVKNECSTGP